MIGFQIDILDDDGKVSNSGRVVSGHDHEVDDRLIGISKPSEIVIPAIARGLEDTRGGGMNRPE